jgi:hypothetical protein
VKEHILALRCFLENGAIGDLVVQAIDLLVHFWPSGLSQVQKHRSAKHTAVIVRQVQEGHRAPLIEAAGKACLHIRGRRISWRRDCQGVHYSGRGGLLVRPDRIHGASR